MEEKEVNQELITRREGHRDAFFKGPKGPTGLVDTDSPLELSIQQMGLYSSDIGPSLFTSSSYSASLLLHEAWSLPAPTKGN